MRAERIVQRHSRREQLANLKTMMKESRPLIEADKQLRKAYMAGYRRRVEEEIAEDKAKQEALQGSLDPATVDEALSQELSPDEVEEAYAYSDNLEGNLPDVVTTGYAQIVDEMKAVPSELEQTQNKVHQLFKEALKPCYDTEDQGTAQADQ